MGLLLCTVICALAHGNGAVVVPGLNTYPNIKAMGFADLNYFNREDQSDDVAGQAVGHIIAELTTKIAVFSEISAKARPANSDVDVERLFIRYDFTDVFQLSGGKYHSPIGYWNSAYHHGAWLQTTVARPHAYRFGSSMVPIHFEGLLAEGRFVQQGSGVGYQLGFGTGKHNNVSETHEDGHSKHDVDGKDGVTARVYLRPVDIWGLDIGLSYYQDTVERSSSEGDIDERMVNVYLAWERESPEFIWEYMYFNHEKASGSHDEASGYSTYFQFAHRIGSQWKPYLRAEITETERNDPLFPHTNEDYKGVTAGLRWDFNYWGALKLEVRNEKFGDRDYESAVFVQVALAWVGSTLAGGGH